MIGQHMDGMQAGAPRRARATVEWPTLALMAACYGLWVLATLWAAALWLPLGIALTAVAITLHSSLQHEALHGHPFRQPGLNAALVFPALGLFVPYLRFRDTHLAHHQDAKLTDPYDDPESNYLAPRVWNRIAAPLQWVLRLNNTLVGRLILGPLISQIAFMRDDWADMRAGDRCVARAWLLHVPAVGLVLIWLLGVSAMPVWAYLVAAYCGMSILKIRTFLEHQAHERSSHRTVIIEDRGPLALLFLNNNLHVVHHMHPTVPWYRLPALYTANRPRYLTRNGGYRYRSYGEVFRRYLLRTKDPVAHPLCED